MAEKRDYRGGRAPERFYADPETPALTLGPFYPPALLRAGEDDLTRKEPGAPRASGQPIRVAGRVTDRAGNPARNVLIEIWQCNAHGKYDHPHDTFDAPLDPNFRGIGRVLTDDDGRYGFLSIKPGAYPVSGTGEWWRPPHIHFSIFGSGFRHLVTQMFFPEDHELNDKDVLLQGIDAPEARARLMARDVGEAAPAADCRRLTFDIVLSGEGETPFFGGDG